jgi:hypothetical protein
MNFYSIYKQIKQRLGEDIPVFFYVGQYLKGKDNTSYRVPAIYIEMPKLSNISYYGKVLAMKDSKVKIHVLHHAPFKNHENNTQDGAIELHDEKLKAIDKLLNGWNATDSTGNKITEQFITDGGEFMQFDGVTITSVLHYQTELYSRHLK